MTLNNETKVIELEEGWAIMQKGITKLKNLLEEASEQQFHSEEFIELYTTIYNMCVQRYPHNYQQQLYDRYKETLEEYINTMILPALRKNHDEYMLSELVKRWGNYKIMGRWLSHFFNYIDRTIIPRMVLPTLNQLNLKYFKELVYKVMKDNVKDVVITLIDRERDGGEIDRALLKNVLQIFVVMGSMDAYEGDFEWAMLTDTAAYYSRKAAAWIEEDSCPDYILKIEECVKRERERVGHYLQPSSQPKLLEKVVHELVTRYENELLEKVSSGCHALLKDDKVEDLSRVFRFFRKRIPNGLVPVAATFRQHLTDEGTTLVKQAEDAASNQKAEKKDRHGGHEQDFVRKVLELHDKYLPYVSKCFVDHWLFRQALKEAFEVFCNRRIAGSTSAELLATFCDNLLTKGGGEGLSDEGIEGSLDKVVNLLAYVNDKDLFGELYRKKLARRLLFDKRDSDDHERSMLLKLKQQCGNQFTSKMVGMLMDLTLAREIQTSFEKHQIENATSNPGIDLTVTVLNTGSWPSYKYSDLALPAEMRKCVKVFEEFYATKTRRRKLTWVYSLGTCNMIGRFDPKPIELIVTTYQAAVLLLFNAADRLSYADIKGHLNLTDEEALRLLQSLSCAKYKILIKDPSTNTVTRTDSFEYNCQFTDKMRRITIPHPLMDEKKRIVEEVDKDRRYAVDACIVRMIKSRKVLTYQQLLVECVEQLGKMFKPDIKIIKKRIEDLIQREYLERDKENPNTFIYMA